MNPTLVNVTIAGICGERSSTYWWTEEPDFYNDQKAMHEAEETLTDELSRQCYLDNLCIATNGPSAEMDGSYKEIYAMVRATAAQRAEAFLRVHGKWVES